ncbi:ROK family transcriptional regulator [Jiangella asiatica]|uniref:ROK family transcriptional regulator n=1 Tax=Jiangella asiatica TaxID=2530372 RepID=A0A4R5DGY1_9ACTN|nr:ROK family transcriptional regulator [Jiangella asiatica]TDE11180.1 ROK family transcriptional regulator [Jiangella asiatica]
MGTSGYAGANHRSVKQGNRAVIFRAIHALGPIARIDLARRTGLNPGTVSNIVDELIESGLAHESGFQASTRAGRRAVDLEVVPSARYAIGLDIARNAVTGAVVDLSGQPLHQLSEPVPDPWEGEVSQSAALRIAQRLVSELPRDERDRVVGVGVGIVGPVDIRARRSLSPRSRDVWQDLDLVTELERQIGLPTHYDNNANTGALAELWFGAGQGVDDFVLLTLGTGIGSGLVLGGDLHHGDHGLAGEVGHMSVRLDGPRCACGNFGCLEVYAAVPRILDAVRSRLAATPSSVLHTETGLTIDAVIAALDAGDEVATAVFDDVARYLAAGIINIIYAVDPQLILLGRELARAGDALIDRVRAEVDRRVFPAVRDAVEIRSAAVRDAPVVGAATLALREFFRAPLDTPSAASPAPI